MRRTPWWSLLVLALSACAGTPGTSEGPEPSRHAPNPLPEPPLAPSLAPPPDLDADDDRILDDDDSCPNEAENYNGIDDADGCPDQGQVIVDDGLCNYAPSDVRFQPNSSELPDSAAPILDAVVATLEGNPQIERIACLGRAGPRERDPQGLSLARARAVCQDLVDRGVNPLRLRALGAGQAAPITAGETFNAAAERSVILEILVVDGVETNRWNGQTLEAVPPSPTSTSAADGATAR
ncbi:MAG: OmpA family protein [Deltaproteobacteria bacterium]|nr:OmpA family protein [Deltaproteobacteria bacterium]